MSKRNPASLHPGLSLLLVAALVAVLVFAGAQTTRSGEAAAAAAGPITSPAADADLQTASLQGAANLAPSAAAGSVHGAAHRAAVEGFLAGFTGGTVPLEEATGEVREFTLEVHRIETEIAPGTVVEQWAFGFPGEAPSVPGPEIRVKQGDLVRITLDNTDILPHTIHPHGVTSLGVDMDGVEHTSFQVLPGERYTYEFVASLPGTHAYHCHIQTVVHLDMGMYGPLIVEPREPADIYWDQDVSLTLDEWDSTFDPNAARFESEPDTFLVNGKAFPFAEGLTIPEGELARVRVTNVGYHLHSMHLHGMSFLVLAKDGYDLAAPYQGDTLAVAPGERYDLLIRGRDGDFPFHDHIVSNVVNRGIYPGGMHIMISGGPARSVTDSPLSVYAGREAKPERMADAAAPSSPTPAANETASETSHDHADPAAHGATVGGAASDSAGATAQAQGAGLESELREGDVSTRIADFAFAEPVLRVRAGTTVTWVNEDAAPHTVTSGLPGDAPETRAFDSSAEASGTVQMFGQGESWSHTFTEPGEYDYYCLPHPFMTAKIIVLGDDAAGEAEGEDAAGDGV